MSRIRTVATVVIVIAIGAIAIRSQSNVQRATFFSAPNQPIPPHTVSLNEYIYLTGQTPSLSRNVTRAVKGDGSAAETHKNYDPRTGAYKSTQRVLMGAGGVYAEAAPELSLLSSLRHPNLDYKRLMLFGDASKNCTESLTGRRIGDYVKNETLLGFQVVKLKTFDDNAAVGYEWRAPQFGCTQLRRETGFKAPDGSIHSNSLLEAISITPGEPSLDLFTFSPQFTLLSPLEYQRRLHKHQTGADALDHELPQSLFQLQQLYEGNAQRPPAKFDPRR